MLNLYLAPRSKKAPVLGEVAIDAVVEFLRAGGIIGNSTGDGVHAPGPNVSALFHTDALDRLLPAELTFDSFSVHLDRRARFLPRVTPEDGFIDAVCMVCEEPVDADMLDRALEALVYRPIKSFAYTCPSCRTELALDEVDFGQPVAFARCWFLIEGAAFGRLTPAVLNQMARRLGRPLIVVPEVVDDHDPWYDEHEAFDRRW